MPPPAAPQQQEQQQSPSLLLALPEPLLLAVLQRLAAPSDQPSLFSAARAHSRLHQAAVAALRRIAVWDIQQQQRLDGVLAYLSKHAERIRILSLRSSSDLPIHLNQLPPNLQLHSLQLLNLHLQLSPGLGFQGVLGHAAGLSALKQLRLSCCMLRDDGDRLAAALEQLPTGLQHLSFDQVGSHDAGGDPVAFPMFALQRLQQLTHLELRDVDFLDDDADSPALQPLQALSRLADLRLAPWQDCEHTVTASMLTGATGLTRLELASLSFEPGVLAGKTQLQHLSFARGDVPGDEAWTAQLLAQLASLQRLTYLQCAHLPPLAAPTPTAYSALTASSRLRHLDVSNCALPAGLWQDVLPAGRQLPHLTSLGAAYAQQLEDGLCMTAAQCSRLVSCCPGLRCLDLKQLAHSPGAFGPLQALSALRTLTVTVTDAADAFVDLCQLAGLQALDVYVDSAEDGLLLQTTQLRQLTRLVYSGPRIDGGADVSRLAQAPDDEPVWRWVLRHLSNSNDPDVAQAAAAALAAAE